MQTRHAISGVGWSVGIGLAILLAAPTAGAQEWIGTFGDWNAFRATVDGKVVCYMSSTPLDMEPKNQRRGAAYVRVTREAVKREALSIVPGYTIEAEGNAVVLIDNAEFRMRASPNGAVSPTPAQDQSMVRAMIAGSRMVVRTMSGRGTNSTDTYSLTGFTAANTAMGLSCR
jgi:hypothetical protein